MNPSPVTWLPKAYSVAKFDTAADIFERRLAPDIGGHRADHARDPAAGFGQVGDFGLDHNCDAFGQAQRGAVDDMCRVDAHIHDDHAAGGYAGFIQPAQDFRDAFFLLQHLVPQACTACPGGLGQGAERMCRP